MLRVFLQQRHSSWFFVVAEGMERNGQLQASTAPEMEIGPDWYIGCAK
jgi:hypothetical protein